MALNLVEQTDVLQAELKAALMAAERVYEMAAWTVTYLVAWLVD